MSVKKIRLNIQTRSDGKLFSVGTYDASQFSRNAINVFEKYCEDQKKLPVDKRHIPPYIEIIADETDKTENEKTNYSGYTIKQLKDEIKRRGIKFERSKKYEKEQFISMLIENDNLGKWDNRFLSPDGFNELSDDESRVSYLDEIFSLPDNIDENSDEAIKYSEELIVAVNAYSGNSNSDVVSDKLKEIIDYYTLEEDE